VWEGVIVKESMWAYPREHSAKQQMRRCYHDFTCKKAPKNIEKTQAWTNHIIEEFAEKKRNGEMVAAVCEALGIKPEGPPETEFVEFE